jgi:hypothetical protein
MTLEGAASSEPSPAIDESCSSRQLGEPWRAGLAALVASQVLRELGEHADDAEAALERALESRLQEARTKLGPPPAQDAANAHAEQDGIHERDASAVAFLRGLGIPGSELRAAALRAADQWAESASAAWLAFRKRATLPGLPQPEPDEWTRWRGREGWQGRFWRLLARVLWHGEVRRAVAIARSKVPRQPATLPLLFVNDYSAVYLSRRNVVCVHDQGRGRAMAEIVSPEGEQLAHTPVLNAGLVDRAQRGAVALRSYLGQRVLRRVPMEVWQRHVAGCRNPRVLSWRGIDGFLEWMGVSSKFHTEALDILRAGQDFRRTWADNGRPLREIGGLWSYDLSEDGRTAPGRHAHLELNVNRPLAPFFAKEELARGDERALVPVVAMPPTVGSPNLWAAAAAFQFLFVKTLVEHRLDVVAHGGALLLAADLARLASDAGMKPNHLPRLLDRWLRDGDDGDAVLERVDEDRYHLADNSTYRQARRYIEETGRLSLRRQRSGREAARGAQRRAFGGRRSLAVIAR